MVTQMSQQIITEFDVPATMRDGTTLRANIYRLRHKLEPVPSEPRYIQGRRGVGYYFNGRCA